MVILLDPQISGISGDMVLSALVDIGANEKKIIEGINLAQKNFDNSKILKIEFKETNKNGISATGLVLDLEEKTNPRNASMIQRCIETTLEQLKLSNKAKRFAMGSIETLIEAESKIHGTPLSSVHLHEAGSFDTVVDILGTAIAMEDLHFFDEEIITTPVAVGGGNITFSHGTTPNPTNAILEIFKKSGIIIFGGQIKEELTTPTGASILVNLTKNCQEFFPKMKVEEIGYGAGQKNFDEFSNVLKIIKGQTMDKLEMDTVQILETNVDDVSGELLGQLIEKIIKKGAKDVTISPAITKKGRPSNLISVICSKDLSDTLIDLLISETGTLGVRISSSQRYIVPRSNLLIPISIMGKDFKVNCKLADKKTKKIENFKIEYDDIVLVSNSLNLSFNQTNELLRTKIKDYLKTL